SERCMRRLRREYPQFARVPVPVVKRYAQLASLAEELRQKILALGIENKNGEPARWVDVFRSTALAELHYAKVVFNLDLQPPTPKDAKDWLDEIEVVNGNEESVNDKG